METTQTNQRLEKITQELAKLPGDKIDQIETLIKSMGKKALSLKEAAQILNVSRDTVQRSVKAGRLKAFRLNKAGDYRIPMEELERFMKEGVQG